MLDIKSVLASCHVSSSEKSRVQNGGETLKHNSLRNCVAKRLIKKK